MIAVLEVRVGTRREREQAYTATEEARAEERVPASVRAARKDWSEASSGATEEREEVVDGTDKVVEVGVSELLDLGHPFACRGAKGGEQRGLRLGAIATEGHSEPFLPSEPSKSKSMASNTSCLEAPFLSLFSPFQARRRPKSSLKSRPSVLVRPALLRLPNRARGCRRRPNPKARLLSRRSRVAGRSSLCPAWPTHRAAVAPGRRAGAAPHLAGRWLRSLVAKLMRHLELGGCEPLLALL
jgi:hypothetical protein